MAGKWLKCCKNHCSRSRAVNGRLAVSEIRHFSGRGGGGMRPPRQEFNPPPPPLLYTPCDPNRPLQESPGALRARSPKKSPRESPGAPGSKKCSKQSQNSLRSLKTLFFETPETVLRLFWTLFRPGAGETRRLFGVPGPMGPGRLL